MPTSVANHKFKLNSFLLQTWSRTTYIAKLTHLTTLVNHLQRQMKPLINLQLNTTLETQRADIQTRRSDPKRTRKPAVFTRGDP